MAIEMPRVVATTRTKDGEYSTILHPDGALETCFFSDDGSSRIIDITIANFRSIHRDHIQSYESERGL